jgi:tryptophan-rich sensory protein
MQMLRPSLPVQVAGLLAWLGLVFVAAALGAVASLDAPVFYAQLAKPGWAPPAWVFGPVWSVLYLLMAIAAWLVWRERGRPGQALALGLFVVQLAANALWSWLFFGWYRGALAFAEVLVLLALVVATAVAFGRIQRTAGWLLAPYVAWVSFASALTWVVWRSNPGLL